MTYLDYVTDPVLLHTVLKHIPLGRRVYQPSTGRYGYIFNQQDHYQAPDSNFKGPWIENFHMQMGFNLTFVSDERMSPEMFPAGFPMDAVLRHSHLHFAPTFLRAVQLYRPTDMQLPAALRKCPSKFVTAQQVAAKDPLWGELLQLDNPHVLFLVEDETCSHPVYLGNSFWPGAPNMPCMFDYDVRDVPNEDMLLAHARLFQTFACTDYDFANGDMACDTMFKLVQQMCFIKGLDMNEEISALTNDDIPAEPLKVPPEIERIVDLIMEAHDADVESGAWPSIKKAILRDRAAMVAARPAPAPEKGKRSKGAKGGAKKKGAAAKPLTTAVNKGQKATPGGKASASAAQKSSAAQGKPGSTAPGGVGASGEAGRASVKESGQGGGSGDYETWKDLPIIDELKLLNEMTARGWEMPQESEASRLSGISTQFVRGKVPIARQDADAEKAWPKPLFLYPPESAPVYPPASAGARKPTKARAKKAAAAGSKGAAAGVSGGGTLGSGGGRGVSNAAAAPAGTGLQRNSKVSSQQQSTVVKAQKAAGRGIRATAAAKVATAAARKAKATKGASKATAADGRQTDAPTGPREPVQPGEPEQAGGQKLPSVAAEGGRGASAEPPRFLGEPPTEGDMARAAAAQAVLTQGFGGGVQAPAHDKTAAAEAGGARAAERAAAEVAERAADGDKGGTERTATLAAGSGQAAADDSARALTGFAAAKSGRASQGLTLQDIEAARIAGEVVPMAEAGCCSKGPKPRRR